MAEQATSTVAAAVIDGITDRALTRVVRTLQAPVSAAHQKLLRLELLVLKVRRAIEVSEKYAIKSRSLLQWRDRLKEAAAEGGEVLLHFQRRASEDAAEAATARSSSSDRQRSTGGGALYFTRSSLSGMALRVRDAVRRLFSTDEDMKKLDSSLEKMELVSPDITQFVMLLQVEVSPLPSLGMVMASIRRGGLAYDRDCSRILPSSEQRSRDSSLKVMLALEEEEDNLLEELPKLPKRHAKRKAPPSPTFFPAENSLKVTLPDSEQRPKKAATALEEVMQLSSAEATDEDTEKDAGVVLQQALRRVVESRCIKAMNDRDMEGLEWLPQWAAVLREAVERGDAVCKTLCPGSDGSREAGGALQEQDDDELYSFARAVEGLASEVDCFKQLVIMWLCPWNRPYAS